MADLNRLKKTGVIADQSGWISKSGEINTGRTTSSGAATSGGFGSFRPFEADKDSYLDQDEDKAGTKTKKPDGMKR